MFQPTDPSYNSLSIVPYQSNSFVNPIPNPSRLYAQPALQPPSIDPYGSLYSYQQVESGVEAQTTYFQPQVSASQSWAVNQPEHLQLSYNAQNYFINNSRLSTTLNSMCNTTSWMSLSNDVSKNALNQIKTAQPIPCDVCKINCNSKDVFQKHILGKKHKRNLYSYTMPTTTVNRNVAVKMNRQIVAGASFVANTPELVAKKNKLMNSGTLVDSVRVCSQCNVVCNSQDVFNKHLTGKRHALQGAAGLGVSQPLINAALQPLKYKKIPKKPKAVQTPAWCEVCKLTCSNIDIYGQHVAGKKHQTNMKKLAKSRHAASNGPPIPMIGPAEKPGGDAVKKKAASLEDLETKKRKMIGGGTAMDAVRVCALCNVVCNSDAVLRTHLSGQKHLAMVKQSQTGTVARGT